MKNIKMFFLILIVLFGIGHSVAFAADPTISSISPTTAHVGDTVTLTGTNFGVNTIVEFFKNYTDGTTGFVGVGVPLPGNTSTSYALTVPPGIKGLATIRIRNMYSDIVSNTITLNVLPISPVIEYVGSGVAYQVPQNTARPDLTELFLHGQNIDSDSVIVIDNQINVNWVYCTKNFVNDTCFYVPSSVSAGSHSMHIKQKDSGLTSNTVSLTVIDKPIISYISKYLTVGAAIQACGIGFDSKSVAVFDGVTEGALLTPGVTVCANFSIPATLSAGSHSFQIKQTDTNALSNLLTITVAGAVAGTPPPVVPPKSDPIIKSPPITPPAECLGGPTAWGCNTPPTTPPILGCSGGNIFNTQTGLPCVNNVGNDNQSPSNFPSQSSGSSTYDFGDKTLRNGSRGEAVRELQRYLNDKLNLGLVLDGKLGPKTIAVIKMWQSDHGLVADGLIGKMTKAQMLAEVN
ncbi:MAG: peptidoglycan-binding protein [Candidatus Paceibacterota bacterium]|jgi:hypothetical protein